ncbi:MAG: IS66 family insertion sequence element accessory protein TnpB [Proteiniphilum sp.]|nr:IS66 family insertion sequence element accessory protein TnpB [Proteiniphilum sp.]MDD3910549.1 IS66 family insertion sequence element accessory protein TnpB [Proteiniphilum sp.]
MFGLDYNLRYFVSTEPVNMNKGINGLFTVIQSRMHRSPINGDVYIFFSANRQSVKLLRWDIDGFLLYYKRLESGTFEVPVYNKSKGSYELSWETINFIMRGVTLRSVQFRSRYRMRQIRAFSGV